MSLPKFFCLRNFKEIMKVTDGEGQEVQVKEVKWGAVVCWELNSQGDPRQTRRVSRQSKHKQWGNNDNSKCWLNAWYYRSSPSFKLFKDFVQHQKSSGQSSEALEAKNERLSQSRSADKSQTWPLISSTNLLWRQVVALLKLVSKRDQLWLWLSRTDDLMANDIAVFGNFYRKRVLLLWDNFTIRITESSSSTHKRPAPSS